MSTVGKLLALGLVLVAGGASGWRALPRAPIARIDPGPVAVWTGSRAIVFGRSTTRLVNRSYVAAAYDPARRAWRRLPGPPGSLDGVYGYAAAWSGREMLVWGQGIAIAYAPAANRWRLLPKPPMDGAGLVVWTGRELIGWGGGCCGDAWSTGAAYAPAANRWRSLARSPLHGSQRPVGAWTGRELVVLVSGDDPGTGKPWPERYSTAAAYDPASDTWRRIAPPPAAPAAATAVWDGRDVVLLGPRTPLAYTPATNRWRRLAPMPAARRDFAAVWTGSRILVWGGASSTGTLTASGLAYDPAANRWSALPRAPLRARVDPAAVWTGRTLLLWGGGTQQPPYRGFTDGATLAPR